MPTAQALLETDLPLPGKRSGKVRDTYDLTLANGWPGMLIVATDRISAFDVIMQNGLPGKGIVLTRISKFWFDRLPASIDHHVVSTDATDIPGLDADQRDALTGRVTIGRKMNIVPIECVVRGYLAGSGWAEYQQNQSVCGVALPAGLKQSSKLPEPIFTPATKAVEGHDENITFERACEIAGESLMTVLRDLSIAIYRDAHDYAADRGVILADTKFEWGLPPDVADAGAHDGKPVLCDEILTPDSSRFWPADQYEPGRDQPSFDKQIVRNYLQNLCDAGQWNKTPPGPTLPDDIVNKTLAEYQRAYRLLTGHDIEL